MTVINGDVFYECKKLTSVTIPNSVTTIREGAFWGCKKLASIAIPYSVTTIEYKAFCGCDGLKAIYTLNNVPAEIDKDAFKCGGSSPSPLYIYSAATLYVPQESASVYQETEGWKQFGKIVEMDFGPQDDIFPVLSDTEITLNTNLVDGEDLSNTVINNVYYQVDGTDGSGYDAASGSLVLNSMTADAVIEGLVGKTVQEVNVEGGFSGLIFEVPAGQGNINIDVQTLGSYALSVKVGANAPKSITQTTRGTVSVGYSVDAPAYVYLYVSGNVAANNARYVDAADNQHQSLSFGTTAVASDNAVKVYSFTVLPDATAIENVASSVPAAVIGSAYSLDGKQLSQPQKGLNIIRFSDGTTRKVVK